MSKILYDNSSDLAYRDTMNKSIKIVGIGEVAAVVTFFALLLAGLGTTALADSEGNWVSMTTVKLGVN